MSGLEGKVVLVTGASSGIGEGTAIEFAKLGCKLSLVSRNLEKLQEVAKLCKDQGAAEVITLPHDLAKSEECSKAVDETVQHYKGSDLQWEMG